MALPIDITTITATIAPGASLSGPVPMGANSLAAIAMPASWTAASLSYQVSPDGGSTWLELYTCRSQGLSKTHKVGIWKA